MVDMTWCQLLVRADVRRRTGVRVDAKPAHTDAEIVANWIAAFKAEHEWRCNDVVGIVTGTKERQSGVITGSVKNGRVMVLFEDGIHWSYPTGCCSVRRTDQ